MRARLRDGVIVEGLEPGYAYPVARVDEEHVVILVDSQEVVCPLELFDLEELT